MKGLLRWSMYVALAIVVAAVVAYAFLPTPVEVEVAEVARGPLEVTVNEDGKTRIKERYVVSSPLAGELLRIDLHAGDAVRSGETVLAVVEPGDPSLLDARTLAEAEARVKAAEARHKHAQAQLERARASSQYAQQEYHRIQQLLAKKATTQGAYDLAEHLVRTTTEDVRAGEFAVQIAEYELQQAQAILTRSQGTGHAGETPFEIRSPISGEVLRVFHESAGMLAAGTQLMELGDPRDLELEIDVLSSDAVRIPPGAKVYLEHWGSATPLLARVRLIEPQAFLKVSALGVEEQRVYVIADFIDPPETRTRLGDAYRVEARIVVWAGTHVLKTNAGAPLRHQGGWAVYRIVNGRARLTPVELGHSSGLETEIIRGLQVDDQVVAYPSDQIYDGVRVTPRKSND